MQFVKENRFNPNPITKFFVMGLLGFTVMHLINPYMEWGALMVLSIMFFLNGFKKDGVKSIITFFILFFVPNFEALYSFPIFLKMMLSLLFIARMFYLTYLAGKFFIKTSDVGSIISSMDYLKIPSAFSIPVAVIFRFFPSYVEERNNIKLAMKIRGIKTKNPIKYMEYVFVPLLIISSNIADDISKAAETKCIENPIKKTRYVKVGVKPIDFIFLGLILGIVVGGLVW